MNQNILYQTLTNFDAEALEVPGTMKRQGRVGAEGLKTKMKRRLKKKDRMK